MPYLPGQGEGFIGSFDMNAERPECPYSSDTGVANPLHGQVFCVRVGSTTHSWRCPQCGNQFQQVPGVGMAVLSPWGSILGAFVPKAKSEFWE